MCSMKASIFFLIATCLFATSGLGAQPPHLAIVQVAANLPQPTSIATAGDSRLFITLQHGQIFIYENGAMVPTPFLDIHSLVSCCGEQGLLSVAFHPRFRENGYFFVNYTNVNGDTTISRYSVSTTDGDLADPSSATILLVIRQPFNNHNGGELQFGPDGYLYIGMGDGGSGGDPMNKAQDLASFLGKILRIDVDSGLPYAIPRSNPFAAVGGSNRPEVWAYGLRNPWRFSFDRQTGDLWIADVGQNLYEEVDLQPRSSIGGENYGWRKMEGMHCYNPPSDCRDASMTLPIIEYTHVNGNCSITGGYRYRGSRFPLMQGLYFFGDYCSGVIWGASANDDGTWSVHQLLKTALKITTFGEGVDGELYVADESGIIYSIVDTTATLIRRRAVNR
jgi:glucose/arabinose dehydrogenase